MVVGKVFWVDDGMASKVGEKYTFLGCIEVWCICHSGDFSCSIMVICIVIHDGTHLFVVEMR